MQFPLVIKATALVPGLRYKFRLSAFFIGSSTTAFSEWGFTTNEPPRPGFLQVEPQSGMAMMDAFDLHALSFTDDADDFTLTYTFYYTDSTGQDILIASALPFNVYSGALLPAVSAQCFLIKGLI